MAPTVSADEVRVLDADGTALPYRRFEAKGKLRGSLVYLHGIQSHGGWYTETAAALAGRGYKVFLPDRRGSGACGEPRGHFDSPEQLVEDVDRFVALAAGEGAPVFLVGGCWGARPAVAYATEHRAKLAGLVLVCRNGGGHRPRASRIERPPATGGRDPAAATRGRARNRSLPAQVPTRRLRGGRLAPSARRDRPW